MAFRIVLERLTPATIHLYNDVANKTFSTPAAHESASLLEVFYPGGMTPAHCEHALHVHQEACKNTETEFYFAARDESLPGKPVVGAARWLYTAQQTQAEIDAAEAAAQADREADIVDGLNYASFEAFRQAQKKGRAQVLGGIAFLNLKVLAVAPGHQRRGIGAALLQWGLDWADEKGVPCYLESSVIGKGLYEKHGFVSQGLMEWDASQFEGVKDPFWHTLMLRAPKAAQ